MRSGRVEVVRKVKVRNIEFMHNIVSVKVYGSLDFADNSNEGRMFQES